MKKIIRLLWLAIVVMAAAIPLNAQTTIFLEDFNDGLMPVDFTLFNEDGLTPHPSVAIIDDAWVVLQDAGGEVSAYSTSWYGPAGQADDWMFTSAIDLTVNNTLSWWAHSSSVDFADGYEVYVAASPIPSPASAVKVFEIAEESVNWAFHSVDLTALGITNQTVYIGFRNHSIDKEVLTIDDIKVTELPFQSQFDAAFVSLALPNEYSSIPFSQNQPVSVGATVFNNGSATLTNVAVTVNIIVSPADTIVSTWTSAPVAVLASGDFADFTFPSFTATIPSVYVFQYLVSSNQIDQAMGNDTAYTFYELNDSLFARDNGVLIGQGGIGAGQGSYLGHSYTVLNPANLTAVEMYYVGTQTGEPYAAAIWSTDATGKPDQIIATTETHYWLDATGFQYVHIPISGGDFLLNAGNYVVTAIEFDSALQLGVCNGISTPGTTWLNWPTNPIGDWTQIEVFDPLWDATFIIRPILQPLCQPIPLVTQTTYAACFNGDGSASVYVGGIVPLPGPFTFEWNTGDTSQTITGFPGIYTVVVSDENGCTSEATVEIGQPDAIAADVLVSDPPMAGANGSIFTTISGGTPPYSIIWNTGETTTSITGPAGTYFFDVTDGAGCFYQSADFVINSVAAPMSGNIVVENGQCAGDAATLAANAAGGVTPYTYIWSNLATTLAISVTASGPYSCTVTDQVGVSIVFSTSVSLPTAIVSSNSSTNATCQFCGDGTATVNPSGGTGPFTFLWDNNAVSATATGLLAGAHSCSITDANGCQLVQAVNVAFDIQAMSGTISVQWGGCPGNPASLTASATGGVTPYTYLWSNGAISASTTVFTSGNYFCSITDFVGTTVVVNSTFTQPAALASTTATTPATCALCPNGSASVSASGGTPPYSYLWNNGGTGSTINGVVPGAYSVVVTDANGCTMVNGASVEFVIGTADLDVIRSLDIFPNPTADFIFINGQLVENESVTLKLTTADGKVIFEKQLADRLDFNEKIDLTDQPAGLFLLTIKTANGQVSRPVVKQ